MSINPVLAAVVGLVVLGQSLQWSEWLAICAIVAANAISALTAGSHQQPAGSGRLAGRPARRGAGDCMRSRRLRRRRST